MYARRLPHCCCPSCWQLQLQPSPSSFALAAVVAMGNGICSRGCWWLVCGVMDTTRRGEPSFSCRCVLGVEIEGNKIKITVDAPCTPGACPLACLSLLEGVFAGSDSCCRCCHSHRCRCCSWRCHLPSWRWWLQVQPFKLLLCWCWCWRLQLQPLAFRIMACGRSCVGW